MTGDRAGADHSKQQACKTTPAPRSVSFAHLVLSFSQYTAAARAGLLCRQMTAFCKLPGVALASLPPSLWLPLPVDCCWENWDQLAAGDCSRTDNRYQDTGLRSWGRGRGGCCTILCVGLGWQAGSLHQVWRSNNILAANCSEPPSASTNDISYDLFPIMML